MAGQSNDLNIYIVSQVFCMESFSKVRFSGSRIWVGASGLRDLLEKQDRVGEEKKQCYRSKAERDPCRSFEHKCTNCTTVGSHLEARKESESGGVSKEIV